MLTIAILSLVYIILELTFNKDMNTMVEYILSYITYYNRIVYSDIFISFL